MEAQSGMLGRERFPSRCVVRQWGSIVGCSMLGRSVIVSFHEPAKYFEPSRFAVLNSIRPSLLNRILQGKKQ